MSPTCCGWQPEQLRAQTQWGFWKKPFRQTFDEAVYATLHLIQPEEQRDAYAKFVYDSGRAVSEVGYWFLDARRAARVDESKVTCPVLVVAGVEDRSVPVKVASWLVAEPGWEEIAGYVADWLGEALGDGGG